MSLVPPEHEEEGPTGRAAPARAVGEPVVVSSVASRRAFFVKSAAAIAAGAGTVAVAQRGTMASFRRNTSPTNSAPKVPGLFHNAPPDLAERWGTPEVRLVRRITMGMSAADVADARTLGYEAYLEKQLAYSSIDDSSVAAFITAQYPELAMDGTALAALNATTLERQLQEATLFRAAFSNRQLYERMVEFWSDHFNISVRKVGYLKLLDDRDVIRANALGKFPDMVRASAHSAAMLAYLDNNTSRFPNVNQNYARELMELHTLGVDAGYIQTDVAEVARCFSGWTLGTRGQFVFDATGHDYGAKSFLGQNIAAAPGPGAAGQRDGEKVLDVLVVHPNTANFIAKKMARWLLRYDPPANLVASVASIYLATGGSIVPMIREILKRENLLNAPVKQKRPFHFVASALRSLNPKVTKLSTIAQTQLANLGHESFLWETPDGYPDTVEYWSGGIMTRWQFGDYVTALTTGEVIVDPTAFRPSDTPDAITGAISSGMFAGELPSTTSGRIKSYLAAAPITTTRVREALALAINSSSFQWY
ncbi:MAG: DUF1800 domain-containing protein [Gemmatimonadota bacterium]|nr:DUF1800 domain-containing protein [Gemmatimonadota bacterium]